MPLILGTNSIKDTGFNIDDSCRFNSGDSAKMGKTFSSDSNSRTTWTVSAWVKRSKLGATQDVVAAFRSTDGKQTDIIRFESDDELAYWGTHTNGAPNANLNTSRKFRDTNAWYHICVRVDTTQGTAADRVRIYVNGTQETSFSTETYPAQNGETIWGVSTNVEHTIGSISSANYFDGYVAEVVYLDGQSAAPTSFGEFDEDSPTIWKPINVSGLTFGNNSFYLDFADSGDLGDDESGNGNDFSETNLAATDQSSDSPTNNWCTMNPLSCVDTTDLDENNLQIRLETQDDSIMSTIAVSKGKWYWEEKRVTQGARGYTGVCDYAAPEMGGNAGRDASTEWAIMVDHNGETSGSGVTVNSHVKGSAPSDNDIFTYAFDADNGQVWVGVNANVDISGTANVTGLATGVPYFFFFEESGGGDSDETVLEMNFGNPINSISSGNSDGKGYGNFEFAPPSGYYAINTKNLAEYG
mgnify:CR=1 FL=1